MNEAPYPWQMTQWLQVQKQQTLGRLPHALMLSGIRGLGKADFADSLSRAVLCERPANEGRPCGTCKNCLLLQAGTHPDRMQVKPEAPDKPIRIDVVRELIAFLTLSPTLGRRRIVLIEDADALNVFAANSLLKTLEEPSPSALLVLVSERPNSLPATIRSRCQSLRFAVPSSRDAMNWLETRVDDVKRAKVALALTGGAPLATLSLSDDTVFSQRRYLIDSLIRLANDRLDPGTLADTLGDMMDRTLFDSLSAWFRDLIRIGLGAHARENPDYENELLANREKLDLPRLFECLEFTQRLGGLLGNGLNITLQFEALMVRYRAAIT